MLTFPKSVRLSRSSEFLRVKTEGRSYAGRFMILGVLKGAGSNRVGIITSRKVGGAVVRNRVRRRMREVLRLNRALWASDSWLVLVARRAAADASFAELQAEWLKLARRGGFVVSSREEPPSQGGNPGDSRR